MDRSSGSEVSNTMQKVLEVKEAAKKLNEAYKVVIEGAPEGSVQAGAGRSNKTMSEVTREVADDVQKWFSVAVKADRVIASSASAESKRKAYNHKELIAGHLQRLTRNQVNKLNEIKNVESDAIQLVNQMVLSRVGNDVEKANNPQERNKALVMLKAELQDLYKKSVRKNDTIATLANQVRPDSKGYVVARYGTGAKGSFIIPLHIVAEKIYAEEFPINSKRDYVINGKNVVTGKNHVLTGSTQYTGVMRSIETEIKALETISRYVADTPILTREDRNSIAKTKKQEQDELVDTIPVNNVEYTDEYSDIELRTPDFPDDQDITYDYFDYLNNNPESVKDYEEEAGSVSDDMPPITVNDIPKEEFTVDDVPDITTSLEDLKELKNTIESADSTAVDEPVYDTAESSLEQEVKMRLVQVLTNSGVGYASKLNKALTTIDNSLPLDPVVDQRVKDILAGDKAEVLALYKQYKEEIKAGVPKQGKTTTARQAASKNTAAVLRDLQDELKEVKDVIAASNRDIRSLKAEQRKQGWTSKWPFSGSKVAIKLEDGYYATKTGGVKFIENAEKVLRNHDVRKDLPGYDEQAFLEEFGLTGGTPAGDKKPGDLLSREQEKLQLAITDIERYLEESNAVGRKEALERKIKEIKQTRSRGIKSGKYVQIVFDFYSGKELEEQPSKPTYKDKVKEAKTRIKSNSEWVVGLFEELAEVNMDSKDGLNIVYNRVKDLLNTMAVTKDTEEQQIIMALHDKLVDLKDKCR